MRTSAIRKIDVLVRERYPDAIKLHIGTLVWEPPSIIIDTMKDFLDGNLEIEGINGFRYTHMAGAIEVRERLAKLERVGDPNKIVLTAGAMNGLAVALLRARARTVWLPNPGYLPYYTNLAELFNMRVEWYDGFTAEDLYPGSDEVVIINSPHNPTGSIYDLDEILPRMGDAYVIFDVPYEKIYYDDSYRIHLQFKEAAEEYNIREYVILKTLSKNVAMPGLRAGYMILGPDISPREVQLAVNSLINHLGVMEQVALWAYPDIPSSYFETLRRELKRRVEAFLGAIELEAIRPKGAFYIMVKVPGDDVKFTYKLLEEERISVTPGSSLGSRGKGYVRVSVGSADPETLEEAARRISEFAKRFS